MEADAPVAALLVLAVLLLAAADDGRLTLFGLLGQYLLVAYFLSGTPFPGLAFVRVGLGVLVTAGLYLSLRDLGSPRHSSLPTPAGGRGQTAIRATSLAIAAVLMAVGAGWALTFSYPWPGLPSVVSFAAYFLASAGILILILPGDIVRHGLALLLLENAAHLLRFSVAETADLVELAFTGVVAIVLALIIAHLAESGTRARAEAPEEEA